MPDCATCTKPILPKSKQAISHVRVYEGYRTDVYCDAACHAKGHQFRTPCDECWGPWGRRRDFSSPDSPALCDKCAD